MAVTGKRGQVLQAILSSAISPSYTYDANGNRLTRAAGTYPAQSFSYMANSNRETNTSYDGMGNSSRNLETYDAAGRLDSVTASGDTLSLAYNGVGELARTELTRPDACTNAVFTIAIDDFVFTPDGHALHVRTANTAAVSVDYIWLDDLPVAQFQDSYDTQGVYIGTEATYLHSDHLGTPRIGTNASKQITWRNRSDAFGIAELSGSAVVRLRFPGQLSLGVAGLNYNYYRDYDPKMGRYVESDPIGLEGGLNTYGYVGANPLRSADPLGLATCILVVERGRLICIPDDLSNMPVDIPVASGNNANGRQCKNNSACEGRSDQGPIPQGLWEWFNSPPSSIQNGRRLRALRGNLPGRSLIASHPCRNPFGPSAGILGKDKFCSEGCITGTPSDIQKLNKLIDAEPGSRVIVLGIRQ